MSDTVGKIVAGVVGVILSGTLYAGFHYYKKKRIQKAIRAIQLEQAQKLAKALNGVVVFRDNGEPMIMVDDSGMNEIPLSPTFH